MEQIISEGLAAMGLTGQVPESSPALLARYGSMMLEKNQVMNLTAIRESDQAARLHMLDSAALLRCADLQGGKTLIDVGTGAGLPGMALKILVPDLSVTLLDSLQKRLDWLDEVAAALDLSGVTALHARAEEQGLLPGFRDSFDFAAARAVADLRLLCELCLPFVKVGGKFLAMKSVDCDEELSAAASGISFLGGKVISLYDYPVPGTDVTHRVVVIEKVSPTPKGYPRRWAKMQKQPL